MGVISRDTWLHSFRQGEILPPGRTNEQELEKIRTEQKNPELLRKIAKNTRVWAEALRAEVIRWRIEHEARGVLDGKDFEIRAPISEPRASAVL